MKNRTALAIMLTLLFVSFLAGIHNSEAEGTPRVYLNPTPISAAPEMPFSVDVVLENVTNLVGWEFKLFWDNSILECIADLVHVPAGHNWEAPNNFELGPGIEQDYNATNGRYFKALAAIPQAETHPTPFNGTTILVTLTFNVKTEGSCVLDLRETKLVHYDVFFIGHTAEDGYFQSRPTGTMIYLHLCARLFGVTLGDPRWNPTLDTNVDGIIDIYDIVLIAGDFGETA